VVFLYNYDWKLPGPLRVLRAKFIWLWVSGQLFYCCCGVVFTRLSMGWFRERGRRKLPPEVVEGLRWFRLPLEVETAECEMG
jgi:hypothetical protein